MNLKDYATPLGSCPDCGYKFDTASNFTSDKAPQVGSLTICLMCGSLLQFGLGMVVHKAPPGELEKLPLAKQHFVQLAMRTIKHRGFFKTKGTL